MSPILAIVVGVAASVVVLLVWSLRKADARKPPQASQRELNFTCAHLVYLPQIRQALEPSDISYLSVRGGQKLAKVARAERQRIGLRYLAALRGDFEQLMELARVVAVLSPEVKARHEWDRFRLSVQFQWRYQLLRGRFLLGTPAFPSIGRLGLLVSKLAIELENAVAEIGGRAVLPSKFSSPP